MDLDRIEAVLKLMKEYKVAEFAWESEAEMLSLRMDGGTVSPVAVVAAPAVAAPVASPVAPAAPLAAEAAGEEIRSPMVGTFYRAPKPGAPAFVKVGDRVGKGQVLCIIEAMKLMNELECEFDGTIAEILVENEQPVQFGQALFRIVP